MICLSVRILYDKHTGRSRGFGFVYFSDADDARCAKDAMDGKVRKSFLPRIVGVLKLHSHPVVSFKILVFFLSFFFSFLSFGKLKF